MFQFAVTSLWRDRCFHVALTSPRVEPFCLEPERVRRATILISARFDVGRCPNCAAGQTSRIICAATFRGKKGGDR